MSEKIINGINLNKLPEPFFESHPEWTELYKFAWEAAAKNIRKCKGKQYMDCAWDFSRNYQWVWDTCFMLLYAKYDNGLFPSLISLDNFYDLQREDGFIAMTYDLNTGKEVYGERINPPLFAWVEWEYYMISGDSSRFRKVVHKIEKLMDWIDNNRRCEPRQLRNDIASVKKGNLQERGKGYRFYYFKDCGSSGMDDSPRTPRDQEAGKFFDWIDLSSQMALSFHLLAKMNTVLHNNEKAEYWNNRYKELSNAVNKELWCPSTRFYHDRTSGTNFINTKTAASFWTILSGIAKSEKLDFLVEYLNDEKTFNRPIPVPTLSADDCNYCPEGTYWIGGVWAPTNYMITRGLMNAGRGDMANRIAMKYLKGLSECYKNVTPHTLWECYSPEKPLPGLSGYRRERVKPNFVGWSGIGPIAMLIENIMGLHINAPEKKIEWHIRLKETHGIRNLRVGNSCINLKCEFTNGSDIPKITTDCPDDITITVYHKD